MIWLMAVSSIAAVVYLCLAHLHWHGLRIDHEVKPLDVATLLVNIGIGVILQYFLASRVANGRAEKDITIHNAQDVISRLRESNESFLKRAEKAKTSAAEWQSALSMCRHIANALDQLQSSLQLTSCRKCRGLDDDCGKLKQIFFDYKSAVTSDPANASVSADAIRLQASSYSKFVKGLQSLIFTINKH